MPAQDTQADNKALSGLVSSKDAVTNVNMTKARIFPDTHLGELLRSVEGSCSIRSVLLEELKQKFGGLGKNATKSSMDACLTVYAERNGKKAGSKWVIRAEYRVSARWMAPVSVLIDISLVPGRSWLEFRFWSDSKELRSQQTTWSVSKSFVPSLRIPRPISETTGPARFLV